MLIAGLPLDSGSSDGLSRLFRALREGQEAETGEVEAEIWDRWCGHDDPDLAAAMTRAIEAMEGGLADEAEEVLDELVRAEPDWAEVWNKRATLYFVQGRDAESVFDIRRTLELEPRHFGALCGFARIAVRGGDPHAARVALERALLLHPGLPGVRSAIAQLDGQAKEVVH